MIDTLAIVGVGLIGGSAALALKQAGAVRRIVGVGRSRANLDKALELGVIDAIAESPEAAARDAEIVLLALPVGAMAEVFARIAPHLGDRTLVTDAGSTKQDVIAAARAGLGVRIDRFVPGHPIAGAEHSGVEAARVDLYADKQVILTPLAENAAADVARVAALWRDCGARVAEMEAETHDHVFAAVSHLPHLAAFALVDELAARANADLYFEYAGSGFRDFTRIAGSHPEMWRDIALANREPLLQELSAYIHALERLRERLSEADGVALEALFARASEARQAWGRKTQ
jgi:prephenate dehydrogenase